MGGRGECNTLKPRPLPSLTGLRFVLFVSRGCTRYAVLPLPTLYCPPGSKFRARTDRKLIDKSQFAEQDSITREKQKTHPVNPDAFFVCDRKEILSFITYLPLTGVTTGAGATGSAGTCCCCCCWQDTKAAAVRARIAIFFIIILLVLMLFDAPREQG